MQSYMDSPQYRALMAQVLQGNGGGGPQYPGQAVANALSQGLNGYMLGKMRDKGEQRQADYGKTVAGALNNEYDYGETPDSKTVMSRLLGSGNSDVVQDFAPKYLEAQLTRDAQANAPITPYQQRELARQDRLDDPTYQGQVANARRATPEYAGEVAGAQAAATSPYDLQKVGAQQQFTAGENEKDRASREKAAAVRAGGVQSNVQSVQPLGDGTLLKVYRDGHTELTTMDGHPVTGARNDPTALFNQSAAQSGGKAAGTAAEALPTTEANFNNIMGTLSAFDDPKVKAQAKYALGLGGMLPTIPGVNSDFNARAGQLQGQAFLQAFNTLKGSGQITEVEGEKATAAIARLQKSQTTSEFYNALDDAKKVISGLMASARTRGSRGQVVPQMRGAPAAQPATPVQGPTEEDIQHTLKLHPEITREQLMQRLGGK